jgi:hypothetical protein
LTPESPSERPAESIVHFGMREPIPGDVVVVLPAALFPADDVSLPAFAEDAAADAPVSVAWTFAMVEASTPKDARSEVIACIWSALSPAAYEKMGNANTAVIERRVKTFFILVLLTCIRGYYNNRIPPRQNTL